MTRAFTCTRPGCGFAMRADTEDELVEHVRLHADERHGVWLSRGDIRDLVRAGEGTSLAKD